MSKATLTGSCLCGDVVYEVTGDIRAFYHCHCQRCRKISGTGHASNLLVYSAKLTWLRGVEQALRFDLPGAKRFASVFCGRCGSHLPRMAQGTGLVVVPAGSLDQEPPVVPEARIFAGSRTDWSCSDSLPAWETYPR